MKTALEEITSPGQLGRRHDETYKDVVTDAN